MTMREKLINQNIHLNDDLANNVGYVDHDYDLEEHEQYLEEN